MALAASIQRRRHCSMEVMSPPKQPRFLAGYTPWAAHPSCACGPGCGRILDFEGSAERGLAGAGVEEQAQQVGDGRRTVTNEQLA